MGSGGSALRLLYEWAVDRDHIGKSPIVTRDVRVHDGRTVRVAAIAPRDVVRSRVKWLTRRAYRRWRDIGMRGYDQSNTPDATWHGRHDGRNAAFTDVLFSTGLRLREAGGLLVTDLPAMDGDDGRRYLPLLVPSALAKGRGRVRLPAQGDAQLGHRLSADHPCAGGHPRPQGGPVRGPA